ncbi:hypothetical protein HYX12_03945, partial [Candidatus Woesearchaeota archaeon]|nr:hypothetical protein [Candidatus Woesearchaeota archaeon]
YRRGLIIHFEDDVVQAQSVADTLRRIPSYLQRRDTYFDGTQDQSLIPSLEEFCNKFNLNQERRVQQAFYEAKIHTSNQAGYQAAEKEVEKLVHQIDAVSDLPVYVNVASGIVGRRLIHECLPDVIISDTSFPLNGQATVQWMNSHGLSSFPVIGLSATPFRDLVDEVQSFYTAQPGKVYLDKARVEPGITSQLFPAIFFAMDYTYLRHETFLRSYNGGAEFRDSR